jgi:hypothetical protein
VPVMPVCPTCMLPVSAASARGMRAVLVASGQLLLNFLVDALLPPDSHAVILGLHTLS